MYKIKITITFVILLLFSSISSVWATDFNWFNKDSYQTILKQNKNRPFLLLLWSIDCPPCYEELELLGEYLKSKPELKIVLVSTDSSAHIKEIKQLLFETQLKNQELWLFSDISPQTLRYAIDPLWYGELPRSYFFNQCQQRTAVSGKLAISQLKSFMNNSPCQ